MASRALVLSAMCTLFGCAASPPMPAARPTAQIGVSRRPTVAVPAPEQSREVTEGAITFSLPGAWTERGTVAWDAPADASDFHVALRLHTLLESDLAVAAVATRAEVEAARGHVGSLSRGPDDVRVESAYPTEGKPPRIELQRLVAVGGTTYVLGCSFGSASLPAPAEYQAARATCEGILSSLRTEPRGL
jgi:hypothetical protein